MSKTTLGLILLIIAICLVIATKPGAPKQVAAGTYTPLAPASTSTAKPPPSATATIQYPFFPNEVLSFTPKSGQNYLIYLKGQDNAPFYEDGKGVSNRRLKPSADEVALYLQSLNIAIHTVHLVWVKQNTICKYSIGCFSGELPNESYIMMNSGSFQWELHWQSNMDMYNSMLQFELYRIYCRYSNPKEKFCGDGMDSEIWRKFGHSVPTYKFVQ